MKKAQLIKLDFLSIVCGADERTGTSTPLALVPKTSASASSATSAFLIDNVYLNTFVSCCQ